MSDTNKERLAFEEWYSDAQMPAEADWFTREHDDEDEYMHVHTDGAWRGWEARASLTEPSAQVQGESGLTPISELVQCECGDIYQKDSYGAGYMDAAGKCPNCDAADAVQGETPAPLRGEDGLVRYPPSVAQKPYGVIIKALAGLVTAGRTDEQFDADVQPSDTVRAACETIRIALDEVMAHVPKVNIAAPMPQSAAISDEQIVALWKSIPLQPGRHFSDDIVAFARAVLAIAPGLSGWQEIASAPYDVEILVSGINFNDEAKGRHFHVAVRDVHGIGMVVDADFFSSEERWIPLEFITHWMPLPPAPGLAPHQPQPDMGNPITDQPQPEPQEAAERVYLVATGETHEGQETYTRHDVRPPLCDAEVLFSAPQEASKPEDGIDYKALYAELQEMLIAQKEAGKAAEPDMRAICEALGFDPTNHHNAAKCPYCRPPESKDERERARQLGEDWHEGVPQAEKDAWCNRAAGLLLHFASQPEPTSKGAKLLAAINAGTAFADGDAEAAWIAHSEHLNCPACGGSGHVDDVSSQQREPQEAGKAEKCTCIYATAKNTAAVRSGHEMGGYIKERDPSCPEHGTASKEASKAVPVADEREAMFKAGWIAAIQEGELSIDDDVATISTPLVGSDAYKQHLKRASLYLRPSQQALSDSKDAAGDENAN